MALFFIAGNAFGSDLKLLRIDGPAADRLASTLDHEGFDIVEGSITPTRFEVITNVDLTPRIRELGLTSTALGQGGPYVRRSSVVLPSVGASLEEDVASPDYARYDDIVANLQAVAAQYPLIARVVDITADLGESATAEGRDIYGLRISANVDRREDEPSVLFVSAQHAREIATPLVTLQAISQLTQGYGVDATITQLVDSYEIWLVPVWNPDGYEYVFTTEQYWRKNLQPEPATMSVGVDLNRNYPFDWNGNCPGSFAPNDETYRGPSASSEIETQTMEKLSLQERFAKVLDIHSYGRYVLSGYACLVHPFAAFLQTEAAAISTAAGYAGAQEVPPADAELYENELAQAGAFSFLVETSAEFQPPIEMGMAEAVQVWPGLLYMLERPITISGHVLDAQSGFPVVASISIDGVRFSNGETMSSGGLFGRYDLVLPPGAVSLTFDAPGYFPGHISFTATATSADSIDVVLEPRGPVAAGDAGDGAVLFDASTAGDSMDGVSRDVVDGTNNAVLDATRGEAVVRQQSGGGCQCGVAGDRSNWRGMMLATAIVLTCVRRRRRVGRPR